MELDKLKDLWNKNVDDSLKKENLSSGELNLLLDNRSKDNSALIKRRIKIGFAVLFLFMIPPIIKLSGFAVGAYKLPLWYIISSTITLIIYSGLFLLLSFSYKNIKIDLGIGGIKESLLETIKIIKFYKKSASAGLSLLVLGFTITISSDIYYSYSNGTLSHSQENSFLANSSIFLPLSLTAIGILIIISYLLFIWLFNKKFGGQINTLESNLKELETS